MSGQCFVTGCTDDPAVFGDFSSSFCIREELAAYTRPVSGVARSLAGSRVSSVSGEVGVLASGFFAAALCFSINGDAVSTGLCRHGDGNRIHRSLECDGDNFIIFINSYFCSFNIRCAA